MVRTVANTRKHVYCSVSADGGPTVSRSLAFCLLLFSNEAGNLDFYVTFPSF